MVFATIVTSILFIILLLGAYAAVCILGLFYLDLPTDPPYQLLTDAMYVITMPFIIAVTVLTVLTQRTLE